MNDQHRCDEVAVPAGDQPAADGEHRAALQALVGGHAVAPSLREALARPSTPDPAAGQLWRASHGDTTAFVLFVSEVTDGSGDVVVCTPGLAPSPESALPALRAATEAFRSLTAWPSAHGRLHQRCLDLLIEDSDATRALGQRAAQARVVELDADPVDPNALLLAELRDDLAALQAAPALPVARRKRQGIRQLLPGSASAQIALLRGALGLSQNDVMEVLRGHRGLTGEQARTLEAAAGLAAGSLPSGQDLDPGLVAELEHPRWREPLRRLARREGIDEHDARLRAGVRAYALAARESGPSPHWSQRLELVVSGKQ